MEEIERWLDTGYSGKKFCMKCSKVGNLLICGSKTCPIVVHERCVRCPISFDGDGHFCCPYCVCRKAEEELLRARNDFLSKRKDLLAFMGVKTVGGPPRESEENQIDEANDVCKRSKDRTEMIDGRSFDNSKGRGNGDYAGFGGEETSPKRQRMGNDFEGKTQENEPGAFAASLDQVPSVEVKKHTVVNADVVNPQERDDGTNPASRSEGFPDDKKETYSDSEGQDCALKNSKDQSISKSANQDLSIVVYNTPLNVKRKPSRMPASFADGKSSNFRFDPLSSLEQAQQSTSTFGADYLITRKSKRVMWNSEEVEMLRKGVQEFSREKRNIPWRKILEYGHEVFDVNRTPSDLKEKWKKVSSGMK